MNVCSPTEPDAGQLSCFSGHQPMPLFRFLKIALAGNWKQCSQLTSCVCIADRQSEEMCLLWMRRQIVNCVLPTTNPFFTLLVKPKAASRNMSNNIMVSKSFAGISTWSLSIAVDACQPKNVVEGLISLGREYDGWSETSNIGR